MEKIPMTREGYDRLCKELDHLKNVVRPENLAELKQARSYGDLRENFEYDAARQSQSIIEAQIRDLERRLSNAKIVEEIDASRVGIGTRVKLLDLDYDEELEYALVDASASVNGAERVSPESPIGKALLERETGDVVEVPVPSGTLRLKILEITPIG
jgi:transcription elongation factor GreA